MRARWPCLLLAVLSGCEDPMRQTVAPAVGPEFSRAAAEYSIHRLESLLDHLSSVANDIAPTGWIVGWSGAVVARHAARWDPQGNLHLLDLVDGARESEATAVNARGVAVGHVHRGDGPEPDFQAVVWSRSGSAHLLPGSAANANCQAWDINARGQIVGHCSVGDGPTHAMLWHEHGAFEILPPLPGVEGAIARGLNERGDVVGKSHAPVLWTREPPRKGYVAVDLSQHDAFPGDPGDAFAVSDRGEVVGWYDFEGFYWHPQGGYTRVNWEFSPLLAVNNRGEKVGWAEGTLSIPIIINPEGQLSPLPWLEGGIDGMANGITGAGDIVGWSEDERGGMYAVMWTRK